MSFSLFCKSLLPLSLLLTLAACKGDDKDDGGGSDGGTDGSDGGGDLDADGDGIPQSEDCDDDDAAIGGPVMWYVDADLDGFGAEEAGEACEATGDQSTTSGDCNDADAAVHPEAAEICNEIDDDCDGGIDDLDAEGPTDPGLQSWEDADADGFGLPGDPTLTCILPEGRVENQDDCDDTNPAINPAIIEVCNEIDDDCDLLIDDADDSWDASSGVYGYADTDTDSFGDPAVGLAACVLPEGYVSDGTDCNDTDTAINPAAVEICDSIDNNCDLAIDDADTALDLATATHWYPDTDTDSYGDAGNPGLLSCISPAGWTTDNTDCDDTVTAVNPSATEVCNGIDDDCDLNMDDGDTSLDLTTATRWFPDADVDNFGDAANSGSLLCISPAGWTTDNTDCDDAALAVNPAATEVCNDIDDDCDSAIDDADPTVDPTTFTAWGQDFDDDTYTSSGPTTAACEPPTGYATISAEVDCNDGNALIRPNATEICDSGVDNDCDTLSDDADPSLDDLTGGFFYADLDGDTHGDLALFDRRCEATTEWVASSDDCDDDDPANYPGNLEICDSQDNDCDTLADDADPSTDLSTGIAIYADFDNDSFGDPAADARACVLPVGYSTDDTDCDDSLPLVFPGSNEVCDGIDNDCDTLIDDADDSVDSATQTTWFVDADDDGHGDDTDPGVLACDAPTGTSSLDDDCDDSVATTYTGATELHNAVDDDCDDHVDDDQVVSGAAYVVITEFMYRPLTAVTDVFGEWIEVHNPTAVDVVMDGGWKLADNGGSVRFSTTRTLIVPAGGYAVFVRNADPLLNGGLTTTLTAPYASWSEGTITGTLALANTNGASNARADIINIQYNDPDDGLTTFSTIESVEYWNNFNGWPTMASALSAAYSVQLSLDGGFYPADNTLGTNWCKPTTAVTFGTSAAQYGTPGAANQDCTP